MITQAETMTDSYKLHLEPALCKGCELCIKSCPKEILYLDQNEKIAVDASDAVYKCIFCGLCELRCPDFAIWIVRPDPPPRREPGERFSS